LEKNLPQTDGQALESAIIPRDITLDLLTNQTDDKCGAMVFLSLYRSLTLSALTQKRRPGCQF
jgi:hypothetical protein